MSGKLKYSEIVIYGDKKKDEAIKMKIGFIGLGIMGKPMAKNLIRAGYELIVYDFNQDAVEELVSCGAKAAVNGRDAASQAEAVITMLPNSPHVRAAVLGETVLQKGQDQELF